jgi:regulator of protease activity HflC (stomatin/prohibitin superfamily)
MFITIHPVLLVKRLTVLALLDIPTLITYLFWIVPIVVIVLILLSCIRIVREYERAVIFRLGRMIGAKGPGIFFKLPIADNFRTVDLRVVTVDVPQQLVITKDNVSIEVDAVVYYRVFDPVLAITAVENFVYATNMLGQTMLRDILGSEDLDSILTRREELNKRLQEVLDVATDPWGIKVTSVALKAVTLPELMQRAIAKQAEAERERRSRIIISEGELQASKAMAEAAKLYQDNPAALALRQLQTLTEIAREKNLIVVTPTPATSPIGEVLALSRGKPAT